MKDVLGSIDFNVLLMIAGTMGIVALFMESKMPSLLADLIMERVPNVQMAAVSLALLADISFLDFFWYKGSPSMFFAVEIGTILSALILAFLFRKEKGEIPKGTPRTEVTDYVPTVLYLGLLSGATLVGNCTTIGASANIAGIGILRKDGHEVATKDFVRIGVAFTLAAIIPAYIYI